MHKYYATTISTYEELSKFEEEKQLRPFIVDGIYLIFELSQSYPAEHVGDFFNHSNFAMTEAYHEFSSSYEITKFGFFKQGLMSLRTGWELGVLSTYWAIVGKDDEIFKSWLRGNEFTPRPRKILNKLLSNPNISAFNKKFPLSDYIENLQMLHKYVHTRGIPYSDFMESRYRIEGKNSSEAMFEKWYTAFEDCIQLVTILHLLRFPIAAIHYDFIKKFGTYGRSPFCGALFGRSQDDLVRFIGREELSLIQDIAHNDDETAEILNWLDNHPDLSQDEIDIIRAEEERQWSQMTKSPDTNQQINGESAADQNEQVGNTKND